MPYSKRNKQKRRKSKSKYSRKRKYKKRSKMKTLQKKVSTLARNAKYDQGTLVYRLRATNRVSCGLNASAFMGAPLNDRTTMEDIISELLYYNPEDPANLTAAPGNVGTFSHDFNISKAFHKIHMRNNYIVPCKVRVYLFAVKEDTNITPFSAFEQGLIDVGNPSINNALVFPTDSRMLTEIWKIHKMLSCTLKPGGVKTITWNTGKCNYDASISDTHSLDYQRSFKGSYVGFRVEGVEAHDNMLLEFGTGQGAFDYVIDSSYNCLYNAGADIKTVVLANNSDVFTNADPNTTNYPVSANQHYHIDNGV